MTIVRRLWCVLAVLALLPWVSFGQADPHELFIPTPTTLSYLNDVIMADSLPSGARADSQRVYVLQRGGLFLLNTSIRNTNWTLRIKAQDSTGAKPVVFLTKNTTTNTFPGSFVNIQGNVWLRNLVIDGYLDTDTSMAAINGMPGALLTTSTAGWNITVDSCILSNVNGNHVRTGNASKNVVLTNTIFANMGWLGTSNFGAGKAIDLRDVSIDTLIMLNCTYVNSQDRIIRHRASTAPLKYLRFEHNTVVNNMGYHGMLALGWLGKKAIIKDNLFINPFTLGQDTDAVRQAEFEESKEKDAFGLNRMTWTISVPNDSTQFIIRNNIYTISTELANWLTTNGLVMASPLTYHINGKIGADSTTAFLPQSVTLNNMPLLMTRMMTWYRTPAAEGGAGKTKGVGNFNRSLDYDRRNYVYLSDTLNCGYSTSSPAYTAADAGYPAGDLNWFPSRKQAWLSDAVSDVAPIVGEVPQGFSLSQNYPNPFNPSTRIHYTVGGTRGSGAGSRVSLVVYDLLGREVATLVNEQKMPGSYEVKFEGSRLASGLYIYRLTTGSFVQSQKMMLLK
jgi:hypothetical protein